MQTAGSTHTCFFNKNSHHCKKATDKNLTGGGVMQVSQFEACVPDISTSPRKVFAVKNKVIS